MDFSVLGRRLGSMGFVVLCELGFRLRLDNTGALVVEVYPSLLCNRVSEQVDLYIKLKLVIFSFI